MENITKERGQRLMDTLKSFGIEADLIGTIEGATVTMYEVRLGTGVKVSRLKNLVDDLELNLPAEHVRIVSIPSKLAVGIEVPNIKRKVVTFGDMLEEKINYTIPFYIGKNILDERICIDISKTPHLLIAGATGSGKSVCINNLICSVITQCNPKDVKLVLVDPKMVELSAYNKVPHLIGNVITDCDETIQMLDGLIHEMNRRYNLLKAIGVRNIEGYNSKQSKKLNYIVLVMDEFADFMATNAKELEPRIAKLTAMARAVGIHLVLATQRPSADVITGVIKANIPSRISFQVSSSVNSRIILDQSGAEKLIGQGDMLLSLSTQQGLERIQGAYLSDDEVEALVKKVVY